MQARRSRKTAPSGGRKIIKDDFPGDKTMELAWTFAAKRQRSMLNCKLSGRTKSGSTLTVGIVPVQCSRKARPLWGQDLAKG